MLWHDKFSGSGLGVTPRGRIMIDFVGCIRQVTKLGVSSRVIFDMTGVPKISKIILCCLFGTLTNQSQNVVYASRSGASQHVVKVCD